MVIRTSGNQGVGYQGIRGSGKRIDTDSSIVIGRGFGMMGENKG